MHSLSLFNVCLSIWYVVCVCAYMMCSMCVYAYMICRVCVCVCLCLHEWVHLYGGQRTIWGVYPHLPACLRQRLLLTAVYAWLAGHKLPGTSLLSPPISSLSQSGFYSVWWREKYFLLIWITDLSSTKLLGKVQVDWLASYLWVILLAIPGAQGNAEKPAVSG